MQLHRPGAGTVHQRPKHIAKNDQPRPQRQLLRPRSACQLVNQVFGQQYVGQYAPRIDQRLENQQRRIPGIDPLTQSEDQRQLLIFFMSLPPADGSICPGSQTFYNTARAAPSIRHACRTRAGHRRQSAQFPVPIVPF